MASIFSVFFTCMWVLVSFLFLAFSHVCSVWCSLGLLVWVLGFPMKKKTWTEHVPMKKKTWTEHESRMGRWVLAGTSKPYGKEETDTDSEERDRKQNMVKEDYRTKPESE